MKNLFLSLLAATALISCSADETKTSQTNTANTTQRVDVATGLDGKSFRTSQGTTITFRRENLSGDKFTISGLAGCNYTLTGATVTVVPTTTRTEKYSIVGGTFTNTFATSNSEFAPLKALLTNKNTTNPNFTTVTVNGSGILLDGVTTSSGYKFLQFFNN